MPNRQFEMMGYSDVPATKVSLDLDPAFATLYSIFEGICNERPTSDTIRTLRRMEEVYLCMQKSGIEDKVRFGNIYDVNYMLSKFNGDPNTRYVIYRGSPGLEVLHQLTDHDIEVPDFLQNFLEDLGERRTVTMASSRGEPLLYNGSIKYR